MNENNQPKGIEIKNLTDRDVQGIIINNLAAIGNGINQLITIMKYIAALLEKQDTMRLNLAGLNKQPSKN